MNTIIANPEKTKRINGMRMFYKMNIKSNIKTLKIGRNKSSESAAFLFYRRGYREVGMAKEYAKKFYKSTAWVKCRESYIATTLDGICEHCKEVPGYIVDHIVEITPQNIDNPDITLNHENLQYLCLPCHNTKTFGKSVLIREDVMFDANGDLIRREEKK